MGRLSTIAVLVTLGLTVSTAVSAEQVAFSALKCAPLPPSTSGAVAAICSAPIAGLVEQDHCSCPKGFLLVQLSAPASIGLAPAESTTHT